MLKTEAVGKNIEQAIENGLAELKVSREDVEIKIIEKGGLFKKAKVLLIVDEDVEQTLINRENKIKELESKLAETEVVQNEETLESNATENKVVFMNES